jgi:hypothetical protein
MRRSFQLAVAGALLAATAAPALAAPSALLKCDGYGRRQTPGEQVGRGILILGTLGLFGSAERDQPSARLKGDEAIAACTEALTDSRTTGNPVRRAEVLLMRAGRQFEMGRFEEAITDARAARSVELTPLVRAHFDRNIGPAAMMLEALARVSQGRQAEAEQLAFQAAGARPLGSFLIEEALRIMQLTPLITPDEQALLDRFWRLHPNVRPASHYEGAGNWAASAASLAQLVAMSSKPSVTLLSRFAAVQALAGDNEGATAMLARVSQDIDELAAQAQTMTADKAQTARAQITNADELVLLARAQLALNTGNLEAAKGHLAGRPRWLAPAVIAAPIIANVKAKAGDSAAPGIDPAKMLADAAKVQRDSLTGKGVLTLATVLLPRWEDPDVAQDLAKAMLPTSKIMQPKPVRDGAATSILMIRSAALDTSTEALLVGAARATAAKGQDRFAVLLQFSLPTTAREGLATRLGMIEYVIPMRAEIDSRGGFPSR